MLMRSKSVFVYRIYIILMRNFLIFLFIFLSILLETTILNFPLASVVFASSLPFISSDYYFMPFAIGLLFDIFAQRLLGTSSIFYLLVYFIYNRYKKKIDERRIIYRLFYVTLVVAFDNILFYKYFSLKNIIISLVLSLIIIFILSKNFGAMDKQRLRA